MGDRGQVKIEPSGVYLYTHNGGYTLAVDVQRALARAPGRWDDDCYLARIIFDEMKGTDRSELGFGIDTQQHGDLDNPVVVVNCESKLVDVGSTTYRFQDFITADVARKD